MQHYKGYDISLIGDCFVAQAGDGDETVLISRDLNRVHNSIDHLWSMLDAGRKPSWLTGHSIDLDEVVVEAKKTQPQVSAVVFVLTAFATAVLLACLMHIYIKEAEPEIVFTTAICAVAVRFGRFPALVLSALSAVALNLIDIPPVGMLTIPGWEETVYIVVNIIISLALPVI